MFGKKKTTEKKTSSKKVAKKAEVNSRPSTSVRKRSSETPFSKSITTKKIISKNEEFLYISNESHYEQVIERIKTVKKTLWICTAENVIEAVIPFIGYYNNERPKSELGGLPPVQFRLQNNSVVTAAKHNKKLITAAVF